MPSLQSYVVRGNHYWRLVESYRDKHGHPRLRLLRHLGTAEKLLQLLSQAPGRPLCAEERDFGATAALRSEEHTSELQSRLHLVCRLLLEKKKNYSLSLLFFFLMIRPPPSSPLFPSRRSSDLLLAPRRILSR